MIQDQSQGHSKGLLQGFVIRRVCGRVAIFQKQVRRRPPFVQHGRRHSLLGLAQPFDRNFRVGGCRGTFGIAFVLRRVPIGFTSTGPSASHTSSNGTRGKETGIGIDRRAGARGPYQKQGSFAGHRASSGLCVGSVRSSKSSTAGFVQSIAMLFPRWRL